ncbi:flagellar biosynthesis regulator FlaF [Paenirhodobacter ferrireducens]|nr:flagellar biosynthesis regulator FlaF [Sinirhodobacter ferrireducens]
MAKTAYENPAQPIRTLRATEYEVFARVTRRMKQAEARADFVELASAIHDNRRLWTILATDVALPQNPLPAPLRARLFYLAEFTQAHSRKVLLGQARAEVLVDINTAIMRGLRNEGAHG